MKVSCVLHCFENLQLLFGLCSRMSFTMKTVHAKQYLDYGLKHGYDTLILSINKEDPSNAKWVSTMDMRS